MRALLGSIAASLFEQRQAPEQERGGQKLALGVALSREERFDNAALDWAGKLAMFVEMVAAGFRTVV